MPAWAHAPSVSDVRVRLSIAGAERKAARLGPLLYAEWPLLVLSAPTLLFSGPLVPIGLVLIGATWIVRRVVCGHWSVSSGAEKPVLALILALLISLVASVRLEYSAPKFWTVVYGLAAFYGIVNTCRS